MAGQSTDALLAFLSNLSIAHHTIEHAPVFTVAEGKDLKAITPGAHTKNLFLKDKKGALFLVCAHESSSIDLNALAKTLGAARFSFGSPALLEEKLGVTPGSVTLFALINDSAGAVRLVLDRALLDFEAVHFHPLRNTATTRIGAPDMLAFARALGRTPTIVDFSDGAPRIAEP